MRMQCPNCGADLEVPPDAREATCSSCQQPFSVLAAARTLASPDGTGAESAEAPTVSRPKVRVNCAACHNEFTIPVGEATAACPRCGAAYTAAEEREPAAGTGGDVHTAKTVVSEAKPPSAEAKPAAADASLRWMRVHFEDKYDILEFISRGGMGAVYKVRQKQPSRVVALKVMLAGTFATGTHRTRFEREAQAVAELKHPAIVPVFEYGEAGGQPYFTMEFVEGTDLLTHVRHKQLSRQEICRMMVRVCDAIHYAHEHGVIHRDLKPGNIMVDKINRPRILDFGLSRLSVQDDEQVTMLTATGEVMGTPRYMSPEQALGRPKDMDERTDVYMLGLILYELIVGVLPYPVQHARGLDLLRVVSTAKPVRPSALHPTISQDLEIIMLKAIEKDKAQRYQSAEAFAQDLENYLEGRPITARPATVSYRLNRWAWRNRKVLTPVAILLCVMAVLTGIFMRKILGLGRTSEAYANWLKAQGEFLDNIDGALPALNGYLRKGEWENAYDLTRFAHILYPKDSAATYLEPMLRDMATDKVNEAMTGFSASLRAQDYAAAQADAAALSGLAQAFPSAYDDLRERAAAVEPGFDELSWRDLTEAVDRTYTRRDALVRIDRFMAELPGNPHFAEAEALRAEIAAKPPDYYLSQHQRAFARAMEEFDWATTEAVLASAGHMLADEKSERSDTWQEALSGLRRQLDCVIRKETASNLRTSHVLVVPGGTGAQAGKLKCVAVPPDGGRVAAGANDGRVYLWDAETGELVKPLNMGKEVRSAAFSPDGTLLAVGFADGSVRLVSPDGGDSLRAWHEHSHRVESLDFSSDGALLLAADLYKLAIWSVKSGEQIRPKDLAGRRPAAFSPDGRLVALTEEDVGVHLRNVAAGYLVRTMATPTQRLLLAFSPDGSVLATADKDEVVKTWQVESGQALGMFDTGGRQLQALDFSPDGRLLATAGVDHAVRIWDAATGRRVSELTGHDSWVNGVAFGPKGRTLVTASDDHTVRVWAIAPPGVHARTESG
ncbi:MAG: protein kinase domain-containing protein, partial [Planctomycetota bacterium]